MGPSGKRLRSMVIDTSGAAIVEAIKEIPGQRHVCIEEGTQSAWVCELLRPHVTEFVVMVPDKQNGPKDDLRDAWACADAIRTGSTGTPVFKAPERLAALRNAVRAYGFSVRDCVRTKNRLKAVFLSRGLVADSAVYDSDTRGKWLKKLPSAHRRLAEWLGRQLDELQVLRDEAGGWLAAEARTHPIIRTLSTAPGLGPIRCSQLVAIVATPARFRTTRQFWSYTGLSVVTRSSANWKRDRTGKMVRVEQHQTLGLTRKRHPLLKAVFKGAATTVIEQMPDHPLTVEYQRRLAAGMRPNLAKLTLARRIAGIILSMWKNEEEYDPKRHAAVVEA
jgi:transposase